MAWLAPPSPPPPPWCSFIFYEFSFAAQTVAYWLLVSRRCPGSCFICPILLLTLASILITYRSDSHCQFLNAPRFVSLLTLNCFLLVPQPHLEWGQWLLAGVGRTPAGARLCSLAHLSLLSEAMTAFTFFLSFFMCVCSASCPFCHKNYLCASH